MASRPKSAKGASLARNATVSGGIGDGAVAKEDAPVGEKRVSDVEDTSPDRNDSNDVAGPRFNIFGSSKEKAREQRQRDSEEGSKGMEDVMAGDAIVYESNWVSQPFTLRPYPFDTKYEIPGFLPSKQCHDPRTRLHARCYPPS